MHRVQKIQFTKKDTFLTNSVLKTASKPFTSLCYTQDRLLHFSLVRAITQPEGLQAKELLNRFLPESLEWVIDMHRQSSWLNVDSSTDTAVLSTGISRASADGPSCKSRQWPIAWPRIWVGELIAQHRHRCEVRAAGVRRRKRIEETFHTERRLH